MILQGLAGVSDKIMLANDNFGRSGDPNLNGAAV
jgi:hypothetical protein